VDASGSLWARASWFAEFFDCLMILFVRRASSTAAKSASGVSRRPLLELVADSKVDLSAGGDRDYDQPCTVMPLRSTADPPRATIAGNRLG
jgi:hypothetical protein